MKIHNTKIVNDRIVHEAELLLIDVTEKEPTGEGYIRMNEKVFMPLVVTKTEPTYRGDLVACFEDSNYEHFVGVSLMDENSNDSKYMAWCHDKEYDKLNYQFFYKKILTLPENFSDAPDETIQAIKEGKLKKGAVLIECESIGTNEDTLGVPVDYEEVKELFAVKFVKNYITLLPPEKLSYTEEEVIEILDKYREHIESEMDYREYTSIESAEGFLKYQIKNKSY